MKGATHRDAALAWLQHRSQAKYIIANVEKYKRPLAYKGPLEMLKKEGKGDFAHDDLLRPARNPVEDGGHRAAARISAPISTSSTKSSAAELFGAVASTWKAAPLHLRGGPWRRLPIMRMQPPTSGRG